MSTEHSQAAARQFFIEQDQRKGLPAPDIVAVGRMTPTAGN